MYWIKHKTCNPFQIKRNHLVCDSSRSTEERVSFKLICTFIFSILSSIHYGLSIHNASRTYIVPYITMCLSIVYYLIMLKFIIRYITLCIFVFFSFQCNGSINYTIVHFITLCLFIIHYFTLCLSIVHYKM